LFFRQVLYRDLGCASYVLGDRGEAIVVDPRWDIDIYLEIARNECLSITHVLETHNHADHVSGRFRLAEITGARCRCAADGEPEEDAEGIAGGWELAIGNLRVQALATPGHRPEHLAFAVADLSRGSDQWLVLTGDSLLVGDIARPDLAVEPREGAAALHDSLRRLVALDDHVEVWPGHVGGSLCGGVGLSGKTSSTVGYERRHNPLLTMERTAFVDGLTRSLPTRPPNVDQIVALNRGRPAKLPAGEPAALTGDRLHELLRSGVTVLDSRAPDKFDAGHLAGAVNLPVSSPGVGTRAGWALSPDEPIVIVAADEDAAHATTRALQAVGLWQLAGYDVADRAAWARYRLPVAEAHSWDLDQLVGGLQSDAVELVDVREFTEWMLGHVEGSYHLPLHRLRDVESVEIPARGRTTAVACALGVRAAFAASLLRRAGHSDVVRIAGGGVPDLTTRGIKLTVGAHSPTLSPSQGPGLDC
jgi:glyoxylase-like metal-dependent hydrolase (beta-lactamase superfamily II)/rhodanese-related sulfurtransferase